MPTSIQNQQERIHCGYFLMVLSPFCELTHAQVDYCSAFGICLVLSWLLFSLWHLSRAQERLLEAVDLSPDDFCCYKPIFHCNKNMRKSESQFAVFLDRQQTLLNLARNIWPLWSNGRGRWFETARSWILTPEERIRGFGLLMIWNNC